MKAEFISIEECIHIYQFSPDFVSGLLEAGMLDDLTREHPGQLESEQLNYLEQFSRWHDELGINMPGIESLFYTLERMKHLQLENNRLLSQLDFYRSHFESEFEDI